MSASTYPSPGRAVVAGLGAVLLVAWGCAFERTRPAERSLPLVAAEGQPAANVQGVVANFDAAVDYFPYKAAFEHAEQITVAYHRHYKVVDVNFHGTGEHLRFVLHQRGTPAPPRDPDAMIVEVPVARYALGSFRYAGTAARLGVVEQIVAISNIRNVTTPEIQARIDAGDLQVNYSPELIAGREAEIQMGYYANTALSSEFDDFAALGVQVVPMAEHLERTPLAKTEWIKFFSLFFNKEREAGELFDAAAARYAALARDWQGITARPRVFVFTSVRDAWNVFGSNNAFAQLVRDAGGDYVWPDVDNSMSITQRPLEQALERGVDADVWIIGPDFVSVAGQPGYLESLPFSFLGPVRQDRIFLARTGDGPNPYWDHALYQPDAELADFIRMIHGPAAISGEWTFHRQLTAPRISNAR